MKYDLELFLKTAKPEWDVSETMHEDAVGFHAFKADEHFLYLDDDLASAQANHLIEQALVEEGYSLMWAIRDKGASLLVDSNTEMRFFILNPLPTKALCLVRAWNALHKENLNDPIS